jgi:sugar phosphate permease
MGEGIDEYVKPRSHLVSPLILEMTAAVLELGALFGAITCGILADKYCRRQSIFFASSRSFVYPGKTT